MKPILFTTDMVRALLDGPKTVTRRVVKFPPGLTGSHQVGEAGNSDNPLGLMWACGIKHPPYQPSDILYVQETWAFRKCCNCYACETPQNMYQGDYGCFVHKASYPHNDMIWRPSIHMPKDAARLFLRATDVRVERLQDITENGGIEEGCQLAFAGDGNTIGAGWIVTPDGEFSKLWDSAIKHADRDICGWAANPWVWAIEFERISKEEAIKNGM